MLRPTRFRHVRKSCKEAMKEAMMGRVSGPWATLRIHFWRIGQSALPTCTLSQRLAVSGDELGMAGVCRGFMSARAHFKRPPVFAQNTVPPVELLQRLTSADAEHRALSREELRALLGDGGKGLSGFDAQHVTSFLERWTDLDMEVLIPKGGGVLSSVGGVHRVLSLEVMPLIARAIEVLEKQQKEKGRVEPRRRARGSPSEGLSGAEAFTPSLAVRMISALGRPHYLWDGEQREAQERLVSLLSLALTADGGRTLTKATAHELAMLVQGVAGLYSKSIVQELLEHTEGECLRRGLDKFKAADLADLLEGFRLSYYTLSKGLVEAVQERIMRRGYLTKGRGGHTSPADVVRLLVHLAHLKADPSVLDRIKDEVVLGEGFLEALSSEELLRTLRCFHGRCRNEVEPRILEHLASRVEEWAGRDCSSQGFEFEFVYFVSKRCTSYGPKTLEALKVVFKAWTRLAEVGQHAGPMWHWVVKMQLYITLRVPEESGLQHIVNVLAGRVVELCRQDCMSSFTPRQWTTFLAVMRGIGHYPGQEFIDALLCRYDTLTSASGHCEVEVLASIVHDVMVVQERHGYQPGRGFGDMVLRCCSKVELAKDGHVQHLSSALKKLNDIHSSDPQRFTFSQPAVDALIRHIGDPAELIERTMCGDAARSAPTLAKLQSTLALLGEAKGEGVLSLKAERDGMQEEEEEEEEERQGVLEQMTSKKKKEAQGDVQALCRRIKEEGEGSSRGSATSQRSHVLHGVGDKQLASLLKHVARQWRLDVAHTLGLQGLHTLLREATRPHRLEAMDGRAIITLLRRLVCLVRLGSTAEEGKVVLDAWVDHVRMRGLPQVAQRPKDLVVMLQILTQSGLEVQEGLILSIFAEMDRMGWQGGEGRKALEILTLIPNLVKLYGEQVIGLLTGRPVAEVPLNTLVKTFRALRRLKLHPGSPYLKQVEDEMVKKGLHEASWEQVQSVMQTFVVFRHKPGKPFLRAVEKALVHGHPKGLRMGLPKDEKEREALRDVGLRQLELRGVLVLLQGFLVYQHDWDRELVERVVRCCASFGDKAIGN